MRGVEDTLRQSEEQRRAIEAEIESVRADRARLSAALIETTAKVQDAERGAAAAGDKLASLNATADELSRSLERRRGVIADVLAALQRMGSNPPPAILVKPDDMSEAVRAATVMGSVIPELKSEIEAVRSDLDALAKTRKSIARGARRAHPEGPGRLRSTKCASPPSSTRASNRWPRRRTRSALSSSARPNSPNRRRRSRISSPGWTAKTRRARPRRSRRMRPRSPRRRKSRRGRGPRAAPIRARLKPEIAFADAKGQVPLPAAGAILKTFGSPDGLGGTEHGLSLATPAGATVSAPADGAVLFAGLIELTGNS